MKPRHSSPRFGPLMLTPPAYFVGTVKGVDVYVGHIPTLRWETGRSFDYRIGVFIKYTPYDSIRYDLSWFTSSCPMLKPHKSKRVKRLAPAIWKLLDENPAPLMMARLTLIKN